MIEVWLPLVLSLRIVSRVYGVWAMSSIIECQAASAQAGPKQSCQGRCITLVAAQPHAIIHFPACRDGF